PGAVDNRVLMAALRRAVGMPFGLPAWRFLLGPAVLMVRSEPGLVLKRLWVAPGVLTEAGFAVGHPVLGPALREMRPRRSAHHPPPSRRRTSRSCPVSSSSAI